MRGLKAFGVLVKSKAMGPGVYTICSIAGLLLIYVTSSIKLSQLQRVGLLISFGWFLLGNAMYNLNDLFDRGSDEVNARDKPLVRGEVKLRDLVCTILILVTVSLILLALINVGTLVMGMACLGLGVAYSSPPLRLKKRGWGKPLTIASIIMFSTIVGSFALDKNPPLIVFMTATVGAFVSTIYHSHDIRDMEGDERDGCVTLPLVVGKKVTIALAAAGYGLISFFAIMGTLYFGLNCLFPTVIVALSLFNLKRLMGIWPPRGNDSAYEKVRTRNRISIIAFILMFPIGAL